jgi:hypothetical protein
MWPWIQVHVDEVTLTEAKKELDAKRTYQLQLTLADDQLERLGFNPEQCQ